MMRVIRGFSLVEVMVVVAILGVMAAIAAPSLLFEVQKATLNAAADEIGSFVARAQNEAMVSRRCVRVTRPSARVLVAERLNTFDCDRAPLTAAKIDGTAATFIEFARLNLERGQLSIIFNGTGGSRVPDECGGTTDAPGSAAGIDEIRFRPSGRVFSGDANLADDDGVLVVRHAAMGAGRDEQAVLVNGHGLICVLPRGTNLGAGPDFNCPQ